MKLADELTLVGIALGAAGSVLGMLGVFMQTNGYYSFEKKQLPEHFRVLAGRFFRRGPAAAWEYMKSTVRSGEAVGEDRAQSLLGLYCVFFGFLLQLISAGFLVFALFR